MAAKELFSNDASRRRKPFVIGVAGGTASGKTSVCGKIMEQLKQTCKESHKQVIIISQDNFYRVLEREEHTLAETGQFNFDHPDAFDNNMAIETLKQLINGIPVRIPVYDIKTNSRIADSSTLIHPADVILFEGILVLYQQDFRDLLDMKLFVDTDPDTRLARRVLRDTQEHGRELDKVLQQYTNLVKPAFEEFCLPTKKYADVIIPRGADNTVAIDLIVQHIRDILAGNENGIRKSTQSSPGSKRTRTRSESSAGSRPH